MTTKTPPVESIKELNVNRYTGRWYEIASYPKWFERDMSDVQANYTLNKKGYIDVLNQGIKHGKHHQAHGKAKVVDKISNAKLLVSFFGPIYSPYWVIALSENYTWAVVSDPKRKSLWILSRTSQIEDALYDEILALIKAQAYDLGRLVKMQHSL